MGCLGVWLVHELLGLLVCRFFRFLTKKVEGA